MISFEEALAAVLAHSDALASTTIPIEDSLCQVLAQPVRATIDLPTFDNSAVDGYGVHVVDIANATRETPAQLSLNRTIRAGEDAGAYHLQQGHAVKILTGAWVPQGVEAVVMKEYAEQRGDHVHIHRSAAPGENIRRRGEEFSKGQTVVRAGTWISPPAVGLLATVGLTEVAVHRSPRVTVIVTGDELIRPGSPLKAGQIYESNSYAIAAILRKMGISQVRTSHAQDNRDALQEAISGALGCCDAIITVGGVSVGDYDFVKDVLAELGVEQVFWKINMKPGKPNYFGVHAAEQENKTLVFGLPGNPVSAQVSLHQLVRPALQKMMGLREPKRQMILAVLTKGVNRKAGRREFLRGIASMRDGQFVVDCVAGQGSHMQGGLVQANCLIDVPTEQGELQEGEQVRIELLTWM